MKQGLLNKGKPGRCWRVMLATTFILTTILGPLGTKTVYAAVVVSRDLPATVSPGASFNVTISFSAPADNFNAIGLTDFAPTSWNTTVNVAWCNPTPMDSLATGNRADYIWAGPHPSGTAFTAVYQVTVPANASPGSYNFGNGRLEYYLGGSGPFTDNITGDSSVTVLGVPPAVTTENVTGVTTNVTGAEEKTPEPLPPPPPTQTQPPKDNSVEIESKPPEEVALPPSPPAPSGAPEKAPSPPAPGSVPEKAPSPPPPVGTAFNWSIVWGIMAGVIIVGLLVFFLIKRRAY